MPCACVHLALKSRGGSHIAPAHIISFSDYIRRGLDLGLLTGVVFIDLHKAFDSVDHEILINKLDLRTLH